MKRIAAAFLLCLFPGIAGSKEDMRVRHDIVWSGGEIQADIAQVKPSQENQAEKSLVYGRLTFRHLKQVGTRVNLACIALSVGDVKSENIYVDSIAHVMPGTYLLARDPTRVSVYWKMEKRVDPSFAAGELKVVLKKGCDLTSK